MLHIKLLIFTSFFLIGIICKAQENPSLNFIDSLTSIILTQEWDSPEQLKAVDTLRVKLMVYLKNLNLSQNEKNIAWNSLRELEFKKGVFSSLNPSLRPDTIDIKVYAIEKKLMSLKDSMNFIRNNLMEMVADKKRSNKFRLKATNVLLTIHEPMVLDFIFLNQSKFAFGKLNSDLIDADLYKNALLRIREEYTSPRDWTIFPYLYENLKYSHEVVSIIQDLLNKSDKLNAPHLLLEFMEANAFPESLELIKYMLKLSRFKKKLKYQKQKKNLPYILLIH